MLPIITVLLFPPSESCQNGNKKHKYTESTGSHGIPIVKKKNSEGKESIFPSRYRHGFGPVLHQGRYV